MRPRRDADEDLLEDLEREDDSLILGKLAALAAVVWNLLLHDGLPAALAWAVSAGEGLDVFSGFIEPDLQARLGRFGLFLSIVAAIVTTESVTRLVRPFGLGHLVLTLAFVGAALFPFLAGRQPLRLGLTAEQSGLLLAYCYLALKVAVGILVGAVVSWLLLSHLAPPGAPAPARSTTRK